MKMQLSVVYFTEALNGWIVQDPSSPEPGQKEHLAFITSVGSGYSIN